MSGFPNVPASTPDPQEELLSNLRSLIPDAFPDGILDAGRLLHALDCAEDGKPSFSFSWPGIEQARAEARIPTTATLKPDVDASLNWDNTRDVLIEGDNLQVLKLLKNGYTRQAKLIYIDPPYNTGETFTYNDDFAVPESLYLPGTGQVDEYGNANTSKIESAGRKHAPWLTMMFPRLSIARHLLSRDGIIMASIDNNEVHHLRLLLDAVFGASNFVDMMTWRGARKGDGKLTAGGQDYILIYARDKEYLTDTDVRWRERKSGLKQIYAQVNALTAEFGDDYNGATAALRAWYRSLPDEDPSKAHAHYRVIDERGVYFPGDISSPNPRANLMYDWKGYSMPENGWRYELETMKRLAGENRLLYPDSKDKRIQVKRYLDEHEDWAPASVFYRDRRAASTALKTLIGDNVFDNPKSTDVISRLVQALTGNDDLIVDFFAGSGSTGHAVWEQNSNDNDKRRWVMVQIPDKPDPTSKRGRAAIKAGYETIFEITAERMRRAANLVKQNANDATPLGFRVFRARESNLSIDAPIIATGDMDGEEYVQASLAKADGEPVVAGTDPLDVAWEVALKSTSTQLDARVIEHDRDGISVYEFTSAGHDSPTGRLLISMDKFDLATADSLKLSADDTLILRGDKVDDSTTLTLASRLQSSLVLLERIPREVSL